LTLTNGGPHGVQLKDANYSGLEHQEDISVVSDVRDDPFVFPRFFDRNTIATVISLPMNAFPPNQENFILWATASKGNELVDYVGRSLRTQLPRFGFLNAIPPGEQAKALRKRKEITDWAYSFFRNKKEDWSRAVADLLQFTFQIRNYDLVPDVMIYSKRYEVGYPNGRKLTDDVVAQSCSFGDCLLQEISFIEMKEGVWPRATKNDKVISEELPLPADKDQFPFLAEKWPDDNKKDIAMPTDSILPYIIGVLAVVAILFWLVVEGIRRVIAWLWRSLHGKQQVAQSTSVPAKI
jgi:hypothetical protein